MDWSKIDAHLAAAFGEEPHDAVFAIFLDRRDSLVPTTTMAGKEEINVLSNEDSIVRIRLATQKQHEE